MLCGLPRGFGEQAQCRRKARRAAWPHTPTGTPSICLYLCLFHNTLGFVAYLSLLSHSMTRHLPCDSSLILFMTISHIAPAQIGPALLHQIVSAQCHFTVLFTAVLLM